MPRRMSCAYTVDQVLAGTKTVTRRDPSTWERLRPGDRLTLIEKGMGLPSGARQRVLTEVVIVSNRVEPLAGIAEPGELAREGFPTMPAAEFAVWWARSHGHGTLTAAEAFRLDCRRIEWEYPAETTGRLSCA